MNINKIGFSLLLGLMVVGCDSRVNDVQQKIAEIQNKPPRAIEKAPEFLPVATFDYAAHKLRSPFIPSSLATELIMNAGKRVKLDKARIKQDLENYPLESLNVKGSLRGKSGITFALIQTPDGQVERIRVGNYLGLNQGRVVRITPTQIDLIEIIPDGRDGFVERPRSLVLLDVVVPEVAPKTDTAPENAPVQGEKSI